MPPRWVIFVAVWLFGGCTLLVSDDPVISEIDAAVETSLCVTGVRNGELEGDEECDPSTEVDNGSACTEDCRFNVCGDSHVRDYIESCDGGENCEECVRCDAAAGEVRGEDGRCYYLGGASLEWQDALSRCITEGGELAYDGPDGALAVTLGLTGEAWVGLFRLGTQWYWNDGSFVGDHTIESAVDCFPCRGYLRSDGGFAGISADDERDDFVCMRRRPRADISGGARATPDLRTNHYYSVVRRPLTDGINRFNWSDARNACSLRRADLVSIRDADERAVVLLLLIDDPVTVGLRYESGVARWEWVDGTPLDTNVVPWQGVEPADPETNNCAQLQTSGDLLAVPCEEEENEHFVCEWD